MAPEPSGTEAATRRYTNQAPEVRYSVQEPPNPFRTGLMALNCGYLGILDGSWGSGLGFRVQGLGFLALKEGVL